MSCLTWNSSSSSQTRQIIQMNLAYLNSNDYCCANMLNSRFLVWFLQIEFMSKSLDLQRISTFTTISMKIASAHQERSRRFHDQLNSNLTDYDEASAIKNFSDPCWNSLAIHEKVLFSPESLACISFYSLAIIQLNQGLILSVDVIFHTRGIAFLSSKTLAYMKR